MQIGYFFHLQRALQGDGVIRVPSNKEQGFAGVILLRQRRNRCVQVKGLLDLPWQRLQGSQQFPFFAFRTSQLSRKIDGQ